MAKVRYATQLWLTLQPLLGLVLISSSLWDHFVETGQPDAVDADQGIHDAPEPLIRLLILPGWAVAFTSVLLVQWLASLDGFRFVVQEAVAVGLVAQALGQLWLFAVVLYFGDFAPEAFRVGLPLPLLVAHASLFPVVVGAFHFSGLRFAAALRVAVITLATELVVVRRGAGGGVGIPTPDRCWCSAPSPSRPRLRPRRANPYPALQLRSSPSAGTAQQATSRRSRWSCSRPWRWLCPRGPMKSACKRSF